MLIQIDVLNILLFFLIVAHGAAILAAVLSEKSGLPPFLVKDVTPLTIGVVGERNGIKFCRTVIKRNTELPTEEILCGSTNKHYQVRGSIRLVEG